MKNVTLASLLMTGLISTGAVADPLTVYGKINVTAQSSDEGDGSFTELKSNNSRFGIKGDYALEDGLQVVYTLEWQVDVADLGGSDNIKSRNQYLGLKGDFGTVLLGRNDTMLKQSQGGVDLFNDYEADLKGLWKGENRLSNTVTYVTPAFDKFSFGITYVAAGSTEGEDGISAAVFYGDKSLKKSNWFASVATDKDINGYDTTRATVQTKLEAWTLGASVQRQEPSEGGTSKNGAMVSAGYKMGKVTYKAQLQTLEDDQSVSLGADYKLGDKTKLFAWYTDRDYDASVDRSWLAVGIEHKF
ncbi:porin [Bowmanella sp. JS7-9]|uniref:Porin n=1 Tax=Pseudobowmanella zhangzhouensis TaxID=1537679 RepID=A0ABW1XLB4_9ALTE|nr:porin [Bowmanella sp. JS7-9]